MSFGFDQSQTPQFPVNYPPQETNKEILQAQEDLMEAIQAFLKEYDHIPPNEKCMALLLAEERFLKIKQTMEEEQNQPGVMQELLLKLMDDLQILKGSQQEKKETTAQSFIPYWNFSMIDDEEARDNFLKDVCTFLRKFSRIPFGVTPKVILIAWESFGKIKDALMDKQYQQEDIQELMSKLLEDVRNIREELYEYINFDFTSSDDESLSDEDVLMENFKTYSNPLFDDEEIISPKNDPHYFNVESNLIESLLNRDILIDSLPKFDYLLDEKLALKRLLLVEFSPGIEKADFDLEEEIHLVDNLLYDKSSPRPPKELNLEIDDTIFESLSPSPILVVDWDIRFLEELLNNDSLPLPEFESFHFDPSSPHPPPEPPDVEISLIFEPNVPVINNFDELNEDECFDPGGNDIDVEVDNSFTFVTQTFLPFLTYPEVYPLLSSTKNEDTIFDPGIST
ncbi:hypothetical protein Tco_1459356 [Tanacetum coccineum]